MEIPRRSPKTVVIGQDGKPSALTIDELKAEFASNPAFAPVIPGSKAPANRSAVVPSKPFHAPNSTRWTRMRRSMS